MKLTTIIAGVAVSGLLSTAVAAMAQNGPGPRGRGYGGPPANEQERIARQEACPFGGQGQCIGGGQGRGAGNGAGFQHRNGLRDGTGPRAGTNAVAGAGFRRGLGR